MTAAELRAEIAELRAEMHQGFARHEGMIAAQTRSLYLGCTGIMLSGIGLACTAAHFA